jgi:hypothetical protein
MRSMGESTHRPAKGDGQFGSSWDSGVAAETPDCGGACGEKSGEILQQPRWELAGKNEEDQPGGHHHARRDGQPPKGCHKMKCTDSGDDYAGRRR